MREWLSLSGFEFSQILPLYFALLLTAGAVLLFWLKRYSLLSIVIFFIGFCTAFFIGTADPFLNIWDEQFHALVAKNMMQNPLRPVLYENPVFDYDYRLWDRNHVWLHKQPLFLWQIMLSIKVFGVNEFAVRFPSMVLFALSAMLTYRLGSLTANRTIGFFGALLFCYSFYPLQVLAGRYPTDHNDIAFLFYVTASLWAWAAYTKTGKKLYICLLAVFSAGAVLTKWLAGLLVYGVWGVSKAATRRKSAIALLKNLKDLFWALLLTVLLVLPWQVYTFLKYPLEAAYEMSYNGKHFFEAVEGHGGDVFFHFDKMQLLYSLGPQTKFILLSGFVLFILAVKKSGFRIGFIAAVTAVYLFFTMAATKMQGFTLPLFSVAMLSMASLIVVPLDFAAKNRRYFKLIFPLLVTGISVYAGFEMFRYDEVRRRHTDYEYDFNFNYPDQMKQMRLMEKIKSQLTPGGRYVIFNADARHAGYVAVMFYTNFTAYTGLPSQKQLEVVKSKGYIPVVCGEKPIRRFAGRDDIVFIEYK